MHTPATIHRDSPPAEDSTPDVMVPDPRFRIVPATVVCDRGHTLADYAQAAIDFEAQGDPELAEQSRAKAAEMRAWLIAHPQSLHGVN